MVNQRVLALIFGTFCALGLVACQGRGNKEKGTSSQGGVQRVIVDGSSTVFPVTEAVSEEFQSYQRGRVRVTVGVSGTGGGFKKFCRGESDVQNASRPISESEAKICAERGIHWVELPIAYDALTVVVNLKNDWIKVFTVSDLKKIWSPDAQGKILLWSDVNPLWPSKKLTLFGAGSDSGTFDYFSEAIVGKAKSSRGDYTASEDDNILVQGISGDVHSLGYIPFSYYDLNRDKLKAVPIQSEGAKEGVSPSAESVISGAYNPLSRPIFIYVSVKAAERLEVQQFVQFYLENVPKLATEVRYVPLPTEAMMAIQERWNQRTEGSLFLGRKTIGVSISELVKFETKK